MSMPYFAVAIVGFLFGAALGSAWLCLLSRLETNEPWVTGRSHCDSCNHVLEAIDLIPVVSYLACKGKCRYCGADIPRIALYAEIVFGIAYAFVFALFMYAMNCYISPLMRIAVAGVILAGIVFPFEHVKKKFSKQQNKQEKRGAKNDR